MEREPKDTGKEATGPNSEQWRACVAADLEAYRAEQHQLYGGIDEMTLARYQAGTSPAEEHARVEQALRDRPALRECLEIARDLDAGREIAPVDASQQKRERGKPWADRTERPETELGKPR